MAFGGENPESYYDEGLTASMKGELELAIEHFERAVRLDSSYSAAYHQLGKCYLRLGDAQKAATLLHQVATAKPRQVSVRVDLGYAFLNLGKVGDARRLFQGVIDKRPDSARAHLGMAHCVFAEGQCAAAANLAQAVVAQGNANFAAFFLVGRAAKRAKMDTVYFEAFKRAGSLIEKSIETSPEQPEGYYLRGEVRYHEDNFLEALENYQKAQQYVDGSRHYSSFGEHFTAVDLLARTGMCLKKLGREDAVREVVGQLGKVAPGHAVISELRGDS